MDWYAEKRGSVLRSGLFTILVVLVVLAGVVVIKGVFTVSVPAQGRALYIVNTFTGQVSYCRGARCQVAQWKAEELQIP